MKPFRVHLLSPFTFHPERLTAHQLAQTANTELPTCVWAGPYTVTFTYVGFHAYELEEVYLNLGAVVSIDGNLESDSVILDEFVVTAFFIGYGGRI